MNKNLLIIGFLATILFLSCAQRGSLTGGDKDTIPPEILKNKPDNFSKNFSNDQITFVFNEYLEIKDADNNFLASPPFKNRAEFKLKNKVITLNIKDTLKPETTYTLDFGNSICDFNEGNPLSNFQFVFSTGNTIDTLKIAGKLINSFDLKPVKNSLVMIYRENSDSVIYKILPDYVAKTDTAGHFSINNIPAGKYKITALSDQNRNYKYDLPNETIAFTDTLYTPQASAIIQTDSLKKGTVLHNKKDGKTIDTLKTDTVINQSVVTYTPSNILLKSFSENKKIQYIAKSSRDNKYKSIIKFNAKMDGLPSFELLGYNLKNWYQTETYHSGDSLLLWFSDTVTANIDSALVKVNYSKRDSADNIVDATDTLKLFYSSANKASNKKVQDFTLKSKIPQDLNKAILIQTLYPIAKYDTSRIKLYEIRDTSVWETKSQSIVTAQRYSRDKILMVFKRPVVKQVQISSLTLPKIEKWNETKLSVSKDSLWISILDEEIASEDTIALKIKYDNLFFFNNIQNLTTIIKLPLTRQFVKSINRETPEQIVLTFMKPLADTPELRPLNFSADNWYSAEQKGNLLILKITNQEIVKKDTLKVWLKTYDCEDLRKNTKYLEDSFTLKYSFPIQKITDYYRPTKNKFAIVYALGVDKVPEVNTLNLDGSIKWNTIKLSATRDTVFYTITDNETASKDTLKLTVEYEITNRTGTKEYKKENIIFEGTKQPKEPIKKIEKSTITIPYPIAFNLKQDSILKRDFSIETKLKSAKKYILTIDSGAFTNIYSLPIDTGSISLTTQNEEFYAKLKLQISNIQAIEHGNINKLKTCSAIIQILDEKDFLIREEIITEDKKLTFEYLPPGTYRIKIIKDINNNKRWDTGNYLKHLQPEDVFFYDKSINLRSNWDTEIDWNITIK